MTNKTALVVSAHSADFVWRAGGAIALHAGAGWKITVVCLSYGERGESAKLWRQDGMTLDKVKSGRRKEAERAAELLGAADIQFWDLGDYPITLDRESLYRLADLYRAVRPAWTMSHSRVDPYNADHPAVSAFAQEARVVAQAHGHNPGVPVIGAPQVYLFEPHQPEQCGWKPNVILNITDAWEAKRAAIECMQGQEHLWEYYTRVALQRGVQGGRNSGTPMTYGEAYEAIFPSVVGILS
ncbi:MAG TPA: PIG-L deacetylase family protein [Luteibacter sp.]|jgi:4-oxalomesaconate hydratase|nr:PIG-L deacetylase family protein [Luteibacter sp.]